MSSCFFSSRERMRISLMSVFKKRSTTAWPKEPVPPVMRRTLSLSIFIRFVSPYMIDVDTILILTKMTKATAKKLPKKQFNLAAIFLCYSCRLQKTVPET